MAGKNSLYFPYWYGEKGDSFFYDERNSLDRIYQSHIEKIKEQIDKQQEKITGDAPGLDKMKDLYDKISEPKNLQEAIEGNEGWSNLSETEKSLWNLSQVSRKNLMAEAYSKAQTIADVANAYCDGVQGMIDYLLADPLQKTIQAALAEKAKTDSSVKSQKASKNRSNEINKVINEWLKTHQKELISVDSLKSQYCSLSDYIVRMSSRLEELREKIALLGSVPSISKEEASDIKGLIRSANSLKACIQGRAGEIASALGLKVALKTTAKYIIDATGQGYDGGGRATIHSDPELKQAASEENTTKKRVSKPDCVVTFTEGGISVSYGVTVKNVNIKKSAGGNAIGGTGVAGTIKLVENSTLLTLIREDIGYTGDSLVGIYEILAGHTKDNGGFTEHSKKRHKSDSSLNEQFNSLRQILRAEAIYSSLTGFAEKDSSRVGSFFMIVNGKFFPVIDVLSKVADKYRESKNVGTTFTIHDRTWSRRKFTEKNAFVGDNGDGDYTVEADTRSDSAKKEIEHTLSTTTYSFMIDKQIIWDIMSSI